jgi:hypothetical protein
MVFDDRRRESMRRNKVDSIRSAHPRVAQLDVRQHPAVSVTSKRSTSKTKWYLAHLLAIGPILNFGLFVYVAIARARTGHVPSPTPLIASIVRLGVPTTLALWIWMLRDNFGIPRGVRTAAWSAALIALNWGAALAYFIWVWRRRNVQDAA